MTTKLSFLPGRRSFSRLVSLTAFAAALAALTACNNPPKTSQQEDAEIQRKSAEATERVKVDAKKAAVAAKPVIESAARRLNDVAVGVKQGLQTGSPSSKQLSKPSAGRLDLNSATSSQLATLPGVSDEKADAIIAARPYASPHQLVKKGILTPAEYQRISGRLTAK